MINSALISLTPPVRTISLLVGESCKLNFSFFSLSSLLKILSREHFVNSRDEVDLRRIQNTLLIQILYESATQWPDRYGQLDTCIEGSNVSPSVCIYCRFLLRCWQIANGSCYTNQNLFHGFSKSKIKISRKERYQTMSKLVFLKC